MTAADPAVAEDTDRDQASAPVRLARTAADARRRLAAAWSGLTRRLRRRAADRAEVEEGETAAPDEPKRRLRHDRHEDEESAETGATMRPSRRNAILLYGALGLAVAAAGGGLTYLALAGKLKAQAAELKKQGEELEAKTRALTDAQKRYLDQQLKLVKTEKQLTQLQTRFEKTPPAAPAQPAATASAPGQVSVIRPAPPRGRAAAPANSGNCILSQTRLGESLKNCIDEFNRGQ